MQLRGRLAAISSVRLPIFTAYWFGVTAGAALLAVAIGGPIADIVNQWPFGPGYRAIFALAGIEFLVGVVTLLRVSEPHGELGRPGAVAQEP